MIGEIVGAIVVTKEPKYSRNLFGEISEISGVNLRVLEKNDDGDCLCISHNGKYLVDIDNRDVLAFVELPKEDSIMNILRSFRKF